MAAFVTEEDYGNALGAEVSIDDLGPVLFALEAACDAIRLVTEQDFDVVVNDEVTLYPVYTDSWMVPQLPVIAVNSVTIDDEAFTDYVVDLDSGIFRRTDTWCWRSWPRSRTVVVNYDHGFGTVAGVDPDKVATTIIPTNLKNIAIQVARTSFQALSRTVGVSAEVVGPFQVQYNTDQGIISVDLEPFSHVLDRYMHKKVPVA